MKCRVRALLLSLVVVSGLQAAAYPQHILHQSGPDADRLTWVVVGDGFRAEEQEAFREAAEALAAAILATSPWAQYREWINIHALSIPSNESGADNPAQGIEVDTFFSATFGQAGVERALEVDAVLVRSTIAAQLPAFDLALVLVNDSAYGGYGSGMMISSLHSGWIETALHELGHAAGHLGDEYENGTFGSPLVAPEPNITVATTRDEIPWRSWIEEQTPVPTPDITTYDGAIGLFEGPRYRSQGIYRPARTCRMRSSGQPFCSVCQEALVLELHRRESLLEEMAPSATEPVIIPSGSQSFSIRPKSPSGHPLNLTWHFNGAFLSQEESVTISADQLGDEVHLLKVVIHDPTTLVRDDPEGLLRETVTWVLSASALPTRRISVRLTGDAGREYIATLQGSGTVGLVGDDHTTPAIEDDLQSWRDHRLLFDLNEIINPLPAVPPTAAAAPPR